MSDSTVPQIAAATWTSFFGVGNQDPLIGTPTK